MIDPWLNQAWVPGPTAPQRGRRSKAERAPTRAPPVLLAHSRSGHGARCPGPQVQGTHRAGSSSSPCNAMSASRSCPRLPVGGRNPRRDLRSLERGRHAGQRPGHGLTPATPSKPSTSISPAVGRPRRSPSGRPPTPTDPPNPLSRHPLSRFWSWSPPSPRSARPRTPGGGSGLAERG